MERTKVLILSPLRSSSGNLTTASRIKNYFSQDGFIALLREPKDFKTVQEFNEFLSDNQIKVVIGLHAFHTSAILKACRVPFILIFGGTDLNEYSKDPKHYETMSHLVKEAEFLVAFSQEMVNSVLELWPGIEASHGKLKLIPQGVITGCSDYDIHAQVQQHISHLNGSICNGYLKTDLVIFTLVAGIRPVKDPLYLVDAFSDWHESCQPNAYLVIIGPVIDEEYGAQFLAYTKHLPGIIYLGSLGQVDTHAAIEKSTALLNTSLSEGNSMAILEALTIGTPVIVRDIAGNRGLVKDQYNGIIYSTPQDFIKKAEQLLNNKEMRNSLVKNGIDTVKSFNSSDSEKDAYRSIVTKVMEGKHQEEKMQ